MKSIVFFNNKGGVGKTTLSCNIAAYLNDKKKKRVLLVDIDPQCNATQSILSDSKCEEIYITNKESNSTIYNYLKPIEEGGSELDPTQKPLLGTLNNFNIDIIPGHPHMSIVEDRLSDSWNKTLSGDIGGTRVTSWCHQLLLLLELRYDLVIFDVGPSLGALNRTVLLACDYIITPLIV